MLPIAFRVVSLLPAAFVLLIATSLGTARAEASRPTTTGSHTSAVTVTAKSMKAKAPAKKSKKSGSKHTAKRSHTGSKSHG